ncbi:AAA family ATPase [Candidatus Woesearchaeota archaeon]|nr:AAA family ATPase [Candidatus Woesearchaeota archaeon]
MEKILISGIPLSGKTTQANKLDSKLEHSKLINIESLLLNHKINHKSTNNNSSFTFYETLPKEFKTSLKRILNEDYRESISVNSTIYPINPYNRYYILDNLLFDLKDANFLLRNNLINKLIILNLSEKELIKRWEFIQNFSSNFKLKYFSLYHKRRLSIFYNNTLPALEYLKKNKNISSLEIDASKKEDEIYKEIINFLN